MSASPAGAKPRLLYVGIQVTGGNGDDWVEPGETVTLEASLYNAGTSSASSVSDQKPCWTRPVSVMT